MKNQAFTYMSYTYIFFFETLYNYVYLENPICDRYASGTLPWGNPNTPGFEPQRHDDGYLEVIGFTYSSLVRFGLSEIIIIDN